MLQVSFLILIAFTLLGVRYGTGRHYWDLKESDIVLAMKVRRLQHAVVGSLN